MTLIELIEYAATALRCGMARTTIDIEFARMGIDIAVVEEILSTLNDDGTYRRVTLD